MANNLPVPLTSFVGRRAELEVLAALVADHRLVTLTGAGGCGKTRLALEVATRVPDDVCWVDLGPLDDPLLVPVAVAAALGMPEPPEPVADAVLHRLSARPTLVVLDTCEHVIEACAALAVRLVQSSTSTRVLATSRELLGVECEARWPVPPLADDESVQLFTDRASLAGFVLGADDAATVAGICRRLDGLPLAIELAAARTRMMGLEQIAEGLADRFRLLTGGVRGALPRQRTLEGSVDWSHDLLGPDERVVFRRLACFSGSFTVEAAEAVCACDVLDLLGALVDRSLVQVAGGAGSATRYRMLETIADYARHRLADAGEAEEARERHLAWCISFAQRARAGLEGPDQVDWLARVDAELDNLRAALDWNPSAATRVVGDLLAYWFARSEVAVGRDRLEAVLCDRHGDDRVERVEALTALCLVAYRAGDMVAAARHGDEAVALGRRLGDRRALGRALHFRAWVRYWGEGDHTGAWAGFEEAESLLRDTADMVRGLNLAMLGWSCIDTRRAPEARALLEEGLRLSPAVGAPRANALFALGWRDNLEGRTDDARAHLDEALRTAQAVGDRYVEILCLSVLALLDVDAGRLAEAQARCERGLALALEHRMPTGEASMRFAAAMVLMAAGDAGAAAAELDAAHARSPMRWFAAVARAFQANVALAGARTDEARSYAEEALRLGSESDSVSAVSMALVTLAELARREPDLREAERLLHEALERAHHAGFTRVTAAALEGLAAVAADAGRTEDAARLRVAVAAGPTELADAVAYVRRGRGTRKRPAHGWEGLTPTERRVVDLVAEGLTNPQIGRRLFVSPRTVQAHLAHVFAKLHVSTRAELAAVATARALDPPRR
ncbi:MAG TPA: LuxR C-terminal-related transcriptional regulator [Acidimicrobiales bacterium]|nr:LuxR C-terminal-related transcriptional regulator [Acidimicrobiales bacterium]